MHATVSEPPSRSGTSLAALTEQIGIVERELEIRRARAARNLQQARAESGIWSGMTWVPIVLLGAIGATAFAVRRRRRVNGASTPFRSANVGGPSVNGTGARTLAIVGALADLVISVAQTPEARELWRAWNSSHPPSAH
jgi:hypothetical protein